MPPATSLHILCWCDRHRLLGILPCPRGHKPPPPWSALPSPEIVPPGTVSQAPPSPAPAGFVQTVWETVVTSSSAVFSARVPRSASPSTPTLSALVLGWAYPSASYAPASAASGAVPSAGSLHRRQASPARKLLPLPPRRTPPRLRRIPSCPAQVPAAAPGKPVLLPPRTYTA